MHILMMWEGGRGWVLLPPSCCAAKMDLHVVFLLELQVLFVESVDSVNHGLDEGDFGVAQAMLVGNVVGVAGLSAGLSAGSTGLDGQLLAPGLQGVNTVLGPAGQVDVDRGSHAGAQVGGARVDVAKLGGNLEVLAALSLDRVLHSLDATCQPLEDTLDVAALLHGDDAELILLVDPDKEGLGLVVEDATALGPVALHTSHLQVGIAGHEEEVIVDQLLADLLVHAGQGVVAASQVAAELGESSLHQVLNTDALLLGDAGGQTESLDGAANTDPDGVNGDLWQDVAVDLGDVHVGGVLEVGGEAVVLADEWVEDILEVDVGVLVTGVDAAVLVVELGGASDGLGQGEAGGLGDVGTQLVPLLLGHVLGNQAVGGLDVGEFGHFLLVCI